MADLHVRVRIPSAGTAAGDFVAAHPDARLTCIETRRHDGKDGPVIDHLALVEGVPADRIEALLDDWDRQYGLPAQLAAGTAFAMHLPLPVARLRPEVAARLKVLDLQGGLHLGHVLFGPHCDLWIECASPAKAVALADEARLRLPQGALVSIGHPSPSDLECWAALRLATA